MCIFFVLIYISIDFIGENKKNTQKNKTKQNKTKQNKTKQQALADSESYWRCFFFFIFKHHTGRVHSDILGVSHGNH